MTTPKTPEGWQPIETAPKDGSEILVVETGADGVPYIAHVLWARVDDYRGAPHGWCVVSSWGEEQGGYQTLDRPTHWMPLPAAPGAPAAPSAEGVGSEGVAPADLRAPATLPESMRRDEMLKYYSEYANMVAHEVIGYQRQIRELKAARTAPTAPAGGEAPAEASDAQLMIVAQEMGLWCEACTAPRESGIATELDITPEDAAEFNAASLKDIRAALKAAGLYTHPSADLRGAAEQALEVLDQVFQKEINRVGTLEVEAHGMCKHFYANLRVAFEAAISRKGKTE